MTYIKKRNHQYSAHSLRELDTCHPGLIHLSRFVLPYFDHKVQEGHRPEHEQELHFIEGRSNVRWPNSRHNSMPSKAMHMLPFVDGRFVGWEGHEAWYQWHIFAGFVIGAAMMLHEQGLMEHRIRWGGDWDADWNLAEHSLRDLAHWELV